MQAGPGKKDYGALSLAVQYYSHPEIVVNVPPSCFMPQPKVGSSVISLKRYEKPVVDVDDEKLMFKSSGHLSTSAGKLLPTGSTISVVWD